MTEEDKYVKLCEGKIDAKIAGDKIRLEELQGRVGAITTDLTCAIRDSRMLEREIYKMENFTGDEDDVLEFRDEYKKMMEMDKITGIRCDGDTVIVSTKPLTCVHPDDGDIYAIGEFDISLTPSKRQVRWNNKTRKVNAYSSEMNAPHIYSDGNACLGNAQKVFEDLFRQYDIASAAMYAIGFVESVNTDDSAGEKLDHWPLEREV